MIEGLINNYEDFGDALIIEFRYNSNFDYYNSGVHQIDEIELHISCFNKNRNFERDLIKIVCKDIIYYNFNKIDGMVFQALLENVNGILILDFFPHLLGNPNGLGLISKEKLDSNCIIKCKTVEYSIID